MELIRYSHLGKIKENSIQVAQCGIYRIVKQASRDKEIPSGGNLVGQMQKEIILSLFYSNLRLIDHKNRVLNTYFKRGFGHINLLFQLKMLQTRELC